MSSAARVTRLPLLAAVQGRAVSRFTVEQYHRMIDAGVFAGAPRCEMVRGYLVECPRTTPRHSRVVSRLARWFLATTDEAEWVVGVRNPITLSDSEPATELYLATGPDDRYTARHPGTADLALVIEVSDSLPELNRGTKLAPYAENKVVQYWIIDVNERRVEVYTDPRGGKSPGYRTRAEYAPGAAVPVVVAGKALGTIAAADLLP
ncbi:MAG TPA: Uma2 family endonuclease [Urbifossiella sp.]|nr:Uma2 family endonuclease [Urbifossiella sp.]